MRVEGDLMFRKSIWFVLILMCSVVYAQTYQLEELIDLGLKNSYQMKNSYLNRVLSDESFNQSLSQILPEASYNYSYTNNGNFDTDIHNSAFSLSKSIYLNDPTYFSIEKSIKSKEIAYLDFKDKQKEFAYTILSAYLDLLQVQKNIDLLKENIILQKRTYEQILIQYNNNKKTIYDLQSSQIDTLTARTDLLELEKSYYSKRQELFQMLNVKDQDYPLAEVQFEVNNVNKAYQENYQTRINRISLSQSSLDLMQSRNNLIPSISLYGNYSYSTLQNELNQIFEPGNYDDSYSYGVRVSYPLFSFITDYTDYRIQKRRLQILENQNKDFEEKHAIKYKQTMNDLNISKQSYEIYKQKAELSKTNLEIAQQRFQLGIINLLDLDKSRIQYIEAQLSLNNKYYSYLKKVEELNYLISDKVMGRW